MARQDREAAGSGMAVGACPPPPPPRSHPPHPPPPMHTERRKGVMDADSLVWFYLDRSGKEFGPYDTNSMQAWYSWGFFPREHELKVRLASWDHHVPIKELYPDKKGVFEDNPRIPQDLRSAQKGAKDSSRTQPQPKQSSPPALPASLSAAGCHNSGVSSTDQHVVLKEAYSARFGWPSTLAGGRIVNALINAVVNDLTVCESGYPGVNGIEVWESPWVNEVWDRLDHLHKGGVESVTP